MARKSSWGDSYEHRGLGLIGMKLVVYHQNIFQGTEMGHVAELYNGWTIICLLIPIFAIAVLSRHY